MKLAATLFSYNFASLLSEANWASCIHINPVQYYKLWTSDINNSPAMTTPQYIHTYGNIYIHTHYHSCML